MLNVRRSLTASSKEPVGFGQGLSLTAWVGEEHSGMPDELARAG